MFGRPRESLRELIRGQHEESRRYLEKRDEEVRAFVERCRRTRRNSMSFAKKRKSGKRKPGSSNREILLRNEKVYTSLIAEMEEGRKQIRANTKAVLSVLDRLNGPDGLAA
jgi:hypothetical protein